MPAWRVLGAVAWSEGTHRRFPPDAQLADAARQTEPNSTERARLLQPVDVGGDALHERFDHAYHCLGRFLQLVLGGLKLPEGSHQRLRGRENLALEPGGRDAIRVRRGDPEHGAAQARLDDEPSRGVAVDADPPLGQRAVALVDGNRHPVERAVYPPGRLHPSEPRRAPYLRHHAVSLPAPAARLRRALVAGSTPLTHPPNRGTARGTFGTRR